MSARHTHEAEPEDQLWLVRPHLQAVVTQDNVRGCVNEREIEAGAGARAKPVLLDPEVLIDY